MRHLFNWAIAQGYCDDTPFKRHGVNVVCLESAAETVRTRRLQPGEGDVQCDATSVPRALVLRAGKTKTGTLRVIPVGQRLAAALDMLRTDAEGATLPHDAFVFGDEVGRADCVDQDHLAHCVPEGRRRRLALPRSASRVRVPPARIAGGVARRA
ncbi:MAG: hypothetical protein ABI880_15525 [Acidobacteriota bacterium]